MPSFSPRFEKTLYNSFEIAQRLSHEYVTLEHLLLALIKDEDAADVMVNCGVDLDVLVRELQDYVTHELTNLILRKIDEPRSTSSTPRQTSAFQRVILRTVINVQSAEKEEINGAYVLVSLFSEPESFAVYFLQEQGMTRLDSMNYVSHKIKKEGNKSNSVDTDTSAGKGGSKKLSSNFFMAPFTPLPDQSSQDFSILGLPPIDNPASGQGSIDGRDYSRDSAAQGQPSTTTMAAGAQEGQKIIELYCTNLNESAKQGRIDSLMGRCKEVERIAHILCRRSKNNPILVGEPGVGKTAIVEGVARLIVEKNIHKPLRSATIFSLDMGALLAGTRYRGDFEERFKNLLKSFANHKDYILFIDEIHAIIGAGAANGSSMDASNLLKPLLHTGQLRCIGSTSYQEYKGFEKDRALLRRFQKIDIAEPSQEETMEIMKGVVSALEVYHGVHFSQEAVQAAVQLSAECLHDRRLPDKAVDVLDEAAAAHRLKEYSDSSKRLIDVDDIENIITTMTRSIPKVVSKNDESDLKKLYGHLSKTVFGQDTAIKALSDSILLARAGLKSPHRPIGSYLLTGPTGVGKTEIARQLSKQLNVELLRFDMSEYMEKHAVSRLIGSPPGYVGFEQGGLLTDSVDKNPHCVLLLDEIEKAHPDIFNVLLQVMDHGQLTDHNGKKVDFQNVILIMTTNAGAVDLAKTSFGFVPAKRAGNEDAEIQRLFSPEFRNRLDAIIPFAPLTMPTMEMIVDKFLEEIEILLENKGVRLTLTSEVKIWLVERGFDSVMGARPLRRLIQESIKKPIAFEILFGRLKKGGYVHIKCQNVSRNPGNGGLIFEYRARSVGGIKNRESHEDKELLR